MRKPNQLNNKVHCPLEEHGRKPMHRERDRNTSKFLATATEYQNHKEAKACHFMSNKSACVYVVDIKIGGLALEVMIEQN